MSIGAHVLPIGRDWITVVGERGQLLATGKVAFRGGYHVKLATGGWKGETFHAMDCAAALDLALCYSNVK